MIFGGAGEKMKKYGIKSTILIGIDLILIICTLSFIFGNSFMNVEKSANASQSLTDIVIEAVPPIKDAVVNNKVNESEIEEFLRSLAHVFEFFLLGAEFMWLTILLGTGSMWLAGFSSVLLCLAVGTLDELFQSLTDRSTQLIDVAKDVFGGTLGCVFVIACYSIFIHFKNRKSKKSYKNQQAYDFS